MRVLGTKSRSSAKASALHHSTHHFYNEFLSYSPTTLFLISCPLLSFLFQISFPSTSILFGGGVASWSIIRVAQGSLRQCYVQDHERFTSGCATKEMSFAISTRFKFIFVVSMRANNLGILSDCKGLL